MSDKFEKELALTLVSISNEKLMQSFLHNMLTPAELEEIAKRLQIFKMLHKGDPQRKISKALNVSIGTISRGSRELKYGEKGVASVLNNFLGI